MQEISQECERRGIGVLEVGEKCKEIVAAVPSSLRVDMLREMLHEFERKATNFSGFEEEDFARCYSEDEEDIVWHKFKTYVTNQVLGKCFLEDISANLLCLFLYKNVRREEKFGCIYIIFIS